MSMLMTLTVFGVMAVFFTTMVFLLIAISASMTLSVTATSLAMMLVFTPAFTAEMIMPILSYLLKKGQKLLLFIIGETFK